MKIDCTAYNEINDGNDVSMAMVMRNSIFYSAIRRKSADVSEEHTASMLRAGSLIGSLFDPEDGDNIFQRNVG
jgi:hypothetical protein